MKALEKLTYRDLLTKLMISKQTLHKRNILVQAETVINAYPFFKFSIVSFLFNNTST